jgi:hypothetical protein
MINKRLIVINSDSYSDLMNSKTRNDTTDTTHQNGKFGDGGTMSKTHCFTDMNPEILFLGGMTMNTAFTWCSCVHFEG